MKNLKILGLTLFSVGLLCINTTDVSALDNAAYYKNESGATLTQEQYAKLSKFFDEDTLNSMTQDAFDLLKDEENLQSDTTVKYIQTDEYYDRDGNLVDKKETEVSEKEALNYVEKPSIEPFNWNITHTTNMKRLTMKVTGSNSVKATTITNTWLSIPKVKSFDVIALRPVTGALLLHSGNASISGYQKWDGNVINYNRSSDNTKIVDSVPAGVAIAMNVVDNTKSTLELSMTLTAVNSYNPYNIYGTYQHATSDVTLQQAQNFNFSYYGLGNCLEWKNGIGSKYDGMQGVYLSYNLGEEMGL